MKFKIFYSWQSDLPGSKTRNFIRECIDDAAAFARKTEAIEAQRDEATQNTTGAPNIVTTLFSKIDDCDLFIADISLCYTVDSKDGKIKRSPNPNVMLELGYAVKILGWERIICLCNTDFGTDYPFDIAHNRITAFSLEGKTKAEVRRYLSPIICDNIRQLREMPPRAREGMAAHIVGSYDPEKKRVLNALLPLEIGQSESFTLHNEELLENAKTLFGEIQKIHLKGIPDDSASNASPQKLETNKDLVHAWAESYKASCKPVIWKSAEEDKERIKRLLELDVPEDFFNFGGLKESIHILNPKSPSLDGTKEEKDKYDKVLELSYDLLLLDVRTKYLETFSGLKYIPLAIQNVSTVQDSDIRVVVYIDEGEAVEPDENLICDECEGLRGMLCRDDDNESDIGIIAELFILPEDGIVQVEEDASEGIDFHYKPPVFDGTGFVQPDKNEQDYKEELEEFIAPTFGRGYYEFNVTSLRPRESKWFSRGMLIKPEGGRIKIHYQISSAHSNGELEGELVYEQDNNVHDPEHSV